MPKTVPNQKIIKIPNRIMKNDYITIDKNTLKNVLQELEGNALKLWLYLYKYDENSEIALSSSDATKTLNFGMGAYNNAVASLIKKGYLKETSQKNYFIFTDTFNLIEEYINTHENDINNKISLGEKAIENLLLENKIQYQKEATFATCIYPNSSFPARFDFYIDHSYLIEYDGEQHFRQVGFFGGEETFQTQQYRDEFKNNWCKENNIPLIRIPYTKLQTLNITDLLLDTTNFKIT